MFINIFFNSYDYGNNYIFAKTIISVTDTTIVEAFDELFSELDNKGYKLRFNAIDNQATGVLKYYMAK